MLTFERCGVERLMLIPLVDRDCVMSPATPPILASPGEPPLYGDSEGEKAGTT